MKTAKDLRAEIERANKVINNAFIAYIDSENSNAQKSYKRMLEFQRKSLEELIKLYWCIRDAEKEVLEDEYINESDGVKWINRH